MKKDKRKKKKQIKFEDLLPKKQVTGGKKIFGVGLGDILARFNMVEIVISLVIVMVALIGVMAVIPNSIERNRDALDLAYAADAADQLVHHMSARIDADWTQTDPLPDIKFAQDDRSVIWSGNPFIDTSGLKIQFEAPNEFSEWNAEEVGTGLFKVTQRTSPNVVDFIGIVRIWKEIYDIGTDGEKEKKEKIDREPDPEKWKKNGKVVIAHYPPGHSGERCHTLVISESGWESGHQHHPYDHIGPCDEDIDENGDMVANRGLVCVIYAEVSWPPNAPYELRTKTYYRNEMAKSLER